MAITRHSSMKTKKIEPLKEGDTVDIIAPGFAPRPNELRGALHFLKSWKLKPRAPQGLIQKHFLHSNSDERRFHFLKQALLAKDSSIIWCLRGGYGANRLWPELMKLKKPARPKLIVGYSDATSLQHFVTQEWGWPTLHASTLDRLGKNVSPLWMVEELKNLLEGKDSHTLFRNLLPMNSVSRKNKSLHGSVIGGNLITLQCSLGTPTQPDLAGKILFLEEIGERAYRIDRALVHLLQSGVLKGCRAIVFGDFFKCEEPTGKKLYKHALQRFADEISIPVWSGVEMGHGEIQRPVFLGTRAQILGGKKGILKIDSGVKT